MNTIENFLNDGDHVGLNDFVDSDDFQKLPLRTKVKVLEIVDDEIARLRCMQEKLKRELEEVSVNG